MPDAPQQQNPDGTWSDAEPLGWQGPLGKIEGWMRGRGWRRLPNLLARIDERGLGR